MAIREKLVQITKGIFADSEGDAITLPYGKAQNTNAGPLYDLTGYLSAMPPLPATGPRRLGVFRRPMAPQQLRKILRERRAAYNDNLCLGVCSERWNGAQEIAHQS